MIVLIECFWPFTTLSDYNSFIWKSLYFSPNHSREVVVWGDEDILFHASYVSILGLTTESIVANTAGWPSRQQTFELRF